MKVVAGYNVIEDNYLVHLYVTPPTGPEIRVFDPPRAENTIDEALDHGFGTAVQEIDLLTRK